MDKVKKLRTASRICWFLGALCTANFMYSVISASVPDRNLAVVLAIAASLSIQYVLTLIESALFDGSLPAPWNIPWKQGGPLPWLCCGAILCLLLDILLNMGGVGFFMSKLHTVSTGPVPISRSTMLTIEIVITIAFATLLAVGSELLDEFANHIGGTVTEHRSRRQERQPERKPEPQPERKQETKMDAEALLARMKVGR